ncbi:MAG: hypothetical protein R2780_11120 [Crocinitomicaceae bacterium]|nr:hypothetical protein [Crocinitomicaceae bacterium]
MKTFITIVLVALSVISRADAWDNLTHEQAVHVKKFVEKNPFVIDFCDCCGAGVDVYLIKIESADIVKCSWDKKQFSVLTKGRRIAKMIWANVGLDDYRTEFINEEVEYTIFMNYTFAFDHHMKWAVPLYKLINYNLNGPICIGATNYPNPSDEGVKITDQDYIDWYGSNF